MNIIDTINSMHALTLLLNIWDNIHWLLIDADGLFY